MELSPTDELCEKKRLIPTRISSASSPSEIDGDQLTQLELDLFFLLLAWPGKRHPQPISGAMVAFFDNPDQWERLRPIGRSCRRPSRRCSVTSRRHALPSPGQCRRGDRHQKVSEGDKVLSGTSRNRDESVSPIHRCAIGAHPTTTCLRRRSPTSAWANLGRMEIRVMFDRLLDRCRRPA